MRYEEKDLETLIREMNERVEKEHPLIFREDDDGVITEKRIGKKFDYYVLP